MSKKPAEVTTTKRPTATQKSQRIATDLTDLLVAWNEDRIIEVKETAQIAAIVQVLALTIPPIIALRSR